MAISEPRILVVGCGALGSRIASDLAQDSRVFGLKRNIRTLPANIEPVKADLQDPTSMHGKLPANLDAVVYCLTPNSYDDEGYRAAFVTGLGHLIDALETDGHSLNRLLFVSSTGVYHQDDDSWVDEDSPTEPDRFSGQRVLEGEHLALNSAYPATVIRYSGIYGPSRGRFLQSVMEGRIDPASPGPYTNRIHEEDAAAAAAHLVRYSLAGNPMHDRYLASDSTPVRLDEIVAWIREQVPCAEPGEEARGGTRAGSKRCLNQRLRDSGFDFRYPGFREGYGELIKALER
ncbi:SDR family oxidoreductase [Marinobacter nanhaiticus D15-8W]|uniref:NAD-dependent epimerase/dehydratase family protein n=1 Tax=Marinobacter nanhaiticus D15-8W TaxID=626887 RepID=N6WUC9_9GAMM|nr:NAD-dependent epimerase/dehydratase family protein [Marinobacter nanhaiticus]ENO14627.1 NAD-dependent epimerase/dehydratase family protein [Marinobacter nanhaiticus D15-8W]BES69687.1 SDR family oxidoreductase [Marinobacter nanhaiticus D15-8W]